MSLHRKAKRLLPTGAAADHACADVDSGRCPRLRADLSDAGAGGDHDVEVRSATFSVNVRTVGSFPPCSTDLHVQSDDGRGWSLHEVSHQVELPANRASGRSSPTRVAG